MQLCKCHRVHSDAVLCITLFYSFVFRYLPAAAAAILKQNPKLIAAAVRTFCNLDSMDLRACRTMKQLQPHTRLYSKILFTRCLFAMLMHKKYIPHRQSGWNLPPTDHQTAKAFDLGMKIAVGLEVLASKPAAPMEQNEDWKSFLQRLKLNGYFDNLIEHSEGYTKKLDNAKEYFELFADKNPTFYQNAAEDIFNRLKDIRIDDEDVKSKQTFLPEDDNEDWLKVSPDDLDRMLSERYGLTESLSLDSGSKRPDIASTLTQNMESFLAKKSEFDGVTVPKHESEAMESEECGEQSESNDGQLNFDPDQFEQLLKNMLDMVAPEKDSDDSDSDMSDFEADLGGRATEEDGPITTLQAYMNEMDQQLKGTTIGQSFKAKDSQHSHVDSADMHESETFDVNVNTLENFSESVQAQLGGYGPTAAVLNSMGLRFGAASKNDEQES